MKALFPAELIDAAEALLAELRLRGLRLATVESCTGGLLAGLLTEIPGASAVIERGLVTYSNAAKSDLAGVSPALIDAIRASIAETGDDSLSGGVRRLAKDGKMEAVDIGVRDWIDVDDPAAHGLASRLFAKVAS